MYKIYSHNFPNGKRYIGITKTSVNKRWGNGDKYKTCVLVNRAIEKYGWENVEHEILDTAESKEEAELKERQYIQLFQSNNTQFGYNILPGGDVSTNELTDEMRYKLGNGQRGHPRTDEEKKKIGEGVKKTFKRKESNGHYGMKHSMETRQKMSESHYKQWENEDMRIAASERMKKRMSDPEYKKAVLDNLAKYQRKSGEYHCSEETKKKLSEINKGKFLGKNSPTSKPVLQYTKDGEFIRRWENAGEAERAGITRRCNISNCCLHRPHYLTAGGYKWEFEDVAVK